MSQDALSNKAKSNKEDIENMILSSFLFLNDLAQRDELEYDMFVLSEFAFTSPFRSKVAAKINAVEDEAYSYLSYELENSIQGTSYEQEWINILSQNSLSLKIVKRYHDKLVETNRLEML